MNANLKYRITIALLVVFPTIAICQETVNPLNEWHLTWCEEFENDSIDWGKWSKIDRSQTEWAKYMSDFDSLYDIKDGCLMLYGIKNDILPDDTAKFLTGGIATDGKINFEEGRIEVCAKFDYADGFWPAIWMLPDIKYHWPYDGEIDIMEHLNFDTHIYQTVHTHYTHNLKVNNPPSSHTYKHNVGEFNIYAAERHADSIVFFINGTRTFTYPRLYDDENRQFPFLDNPYHLILSAQLGGSWVGEVNPEHLPVTLCVDWVRFYTNQQLPLIPYPQHLTFNSEKKFKKSHTKYEDTKRNSSDNHVDSYYKLSIDKGAVTIEGNKFYAQQTIEQLADNGGNMLPDVIISDSASLKIRGYYQDACSDFIPIFHLKSLVDALANYKLNYLFINIIDNNTCRLQLDVFSSDAHNLNASFIDNDRYGMIDFLELVKYAKDKNIEIIPTLTISNEETYYYTTVYNQNYQDFIEFLLSNMCEEIPSNVVSTYHINNECDTFNTQFISKILNKHNRHLALKNCYSLNNENTIYNLFQDTTHREYIEERTLTSCNDYVSSIELTNNIIETNLTDIQQNDTLNHYGSILNLSKNIYSIDNQLSIINFIPTSSIASFADKVWFTGHQEEAFELNDFIENRLNYHSSHFNDSINTQWIANSDLKWKVKVNHSKWTEVKGGVINLDDINTDEDTRSKAKIKTTIYSGADTIIYVHLDIHNPYYKTDTKESNDNRLYKSENRIKLRHRKIFTDKDIAKGDDIMPFEEMESLYNNLNIKHISNTLQVKLKKGKNKIRYISKSDYVSDGCWKFSFIPFTYNMQGEAEEVDCIFFEKKKKSTFFRKN